MLKVIVDQCRFDQGMGRGTVVIRSDKPGPPFNPSFDELESPDAVGMAQQFAATVGCSPAYINGNKSSPYAVNAEGVPLEKVVGPDGQSLPPQSPQMQPAAYQIDIPVCRKM